MCDSRGDTDPQDPRCAGLALIPMIEEHLDQVLAIEGEAFASPWRREHFVFEIRDNRWSVNRVARADQDVVGYTSGWSLGGELKINNIAVRRDWRGRGLGSWLLDRMLDEGTADRCVVAQLEVRPSNAAALALYRRRGFVEVGRRVGFYEREGEDAILMELSLSDA